MLRRRWWPNWGGDEVRLDRLVRDGAVHDLVLLQRSRHAAAREGSRRPGVGVLRRGDSRLAGDRGQCAGDGGGAVDVARSDSARAAYFHTFVGRSAGGARGWTSVPSFQTASGASNSPP